jgi:hypothetical protein
VQSRTESQLVKGRRSSTSRCFELVLKGKNNHVSICQRSDVPSNGISRHKGNSLEAAEASTHLPRLYADVREAALHRAEQQAGGVVGAAACRTGFGRLQGGGGREEGEGIGMSGMGLEIDPAS